jgi:hypothetical protein
MGIIGCLESECGTASQSSSQSSEYYTIYLVPSDTSENESNEYEYKDEYYYATLFTKDSKLREWGFVDNNGNKCILVADLSSVGSPKGFRVIKNDECPTDWTYTSTITVNEGDYLIGPGGVKLWVTEEEEYKKRYS